MIRESIDAAAAKAAEEGEKEFERKKRQQAELAKGLSTPWRVAPVVANAADAASTIVGLKDGLKESNPLLKGLTKNAPATVVAKLALGVGAALAANAISKKNKTAGKVIAGIGTGIPGIAAANNTRLILGRRGRK